MEAVGGSSDDEEEEAEMQPRIRERAPSISSVFMVMLLSWGPAWREEGGGLVGTKAAPNRPSYRCNFWGRDVCMKSCRSVPDAIALLDHYA